jgi:hypothetical protein
MILPPIQPMLAVPAAPFDAAGYCFEIKWDGVRTLAAVDQRGGRLWGRDGGDRRPRSSRSTDASASPERRRRETEKSVKL